MPRAPGSPTGKSETDPPTRLTQTEPGIPSWGLLPTTAETLTRPTASEGSEGTGRKTSFARATRLRGPSPTAWAFRAYQRACALRRASPASGLPDGADTGMQVNQERPLPSAVDLIPRGTGPAWKRRLHLRLDPTYLRATLSSRINSSCGRSDNGRRHRNACRRPRPCHGVAPDLALAPIRARYPIRAVSSSTPILICRHPTQLVVARYTARTSGRRPVRPPGPVRAPFVQTRRAGQHGHLAAERTRAGCARANAAGNGVYTRLATGSTTQCQPNTRSADWIRALAICHGGVARTANGCAYPGLTHRHLRLGPGRSS